MSPRDDNKSESDVDNDDHVAGSRAGKDGADDGAYVGQTASDDALDVGRREPRRAAKRSASSGVVSIRSRWPRCEYRT